MEISQTTIEYLDENVNEGGPYVDDWMKMRDYYTKSLWHQLTLLLHRCLKDPEFRTKTNLIKLNEKFLNDFKMKINPLSLVEMCVLISEQIVFNDPAGGIKFLGEIRDTCTQKSKEAKVLCNTTIGMIYLTAIRDLAKARELIETTQVQLDELDGVTSVHSRFYELSSRYYQISGQPAKFYLEGLRFLGCVDLNTLTPQEQHGWAFSIGLAAILGDGVYNFGELLTHDILNSLRDTPDVWLIDLLMAFNRGDLNQLDALRDRWSTQADLVAAENRLRDKVTLLCLVEMVFRRPPNQRRLTFTEISTATRIPIGQVELFLMKVLSLNLIKGRIDEVDQSITLTWLQPRVLDREQIGSMCTRLDEWRASVSNMKDFVEADIKPIFT